MYNDLLGAIPIGEIIRFSRKKMGNFNNKK